MRYLRILHNWWFGVGKHKLKRSLPAIIKFLQQAFLPLGWALLTWSMFLWNKRAWGASVGVYLLLTALMPVIEAGIQARIMARTRRSE